jgi:2-amino-4-hydroxy-6-hydroxymethyldihydropteridine diphosphokinase
MAHLPRQSVTAYVALGANLGEARQRVLHAFDALALLPSTQLTSRSQIYRTAPYEAQGPDFFNAVARIDTRLTAPDLLDALQAADCVLICMPQELWIWICFSTATPKCTARA